jgi:DNA-binding response OmpR family regulator
MRDETGNTKRILIVEDDITLLHPIAYTLRRKGVRECLAKPFDIKELIARVTALLEADSRGYGR